MKIIKLHTLYTLDEGIEILTGVEVGQKHEDGSYPEGTVDYLVYEKLKKYANLAANFGDVGEDGGRSAAKGGCGCCEDEE